MEDAIGWVALALTLGWLVYEKFFVKGEKLSPETVTNVLEQVVEIEPTVEDRLEEGVYAAEQFKKTGEIPDNNAAFEFAVNWAKKWYPDLDPETARVTINKFVLIASSLRKQAGG